MWSEPVTEAVAMSSTHEFTVAMLLAGPCLAAALLLVSRQCRYFLKYITYVVGMSLISVALVPAFACRPFNVVNLV